MMAKGKYSEALVRIDESINENKISSKQKTSLALLRYKAEVLLNLGELDSAMDIAIDIKNSSENESDKLLSIFILMSGNNSKGRLMNSLELYNEAKSLYEKNPNISDNPQDINLKSKVLSEHARTYFHKGELNLSEKYYEAALIEAQSAKNDNSINVCYNGLAGVYFRKGELENAKRTLEKSTEYLIKVGDGYKAKINKNNIGLIELRQGNLIESENILSESLIFYQKYGKPEHLASSYNNLGDLYYEKGDLEESLDHYHQALIIRKRNDLSTFVGHVESSIGTIYYEMNDLDKAIYFLELAMKSYQEIGAEKKIARTIFTLIRIYLLKDNPDRVSELMNQLNTLTKTLDDRISHHILKLSQALVFKQGSRIRDITKSQELLKEIVNDEISDYSLTLLAMVFYCELLLIEVDIINEPNIWSEINTIFQTIHQTATKNHLFPLIIRSLTLQSRLSMIQNDFQKANLLLAQGLELTNKKNLYTLQKDILLEIERSAKFKSRWSNSSHVTELSNEIEISEYLQHISKMMKSERDI